MIPKKVLREDAVRADQDNSEINYSRFQMQKLEYKVLPVRSCGVGKPREAKML